MDKSKHVPMKFLAKSLRKKFIANGMKDLLPQVEALTWQRIEDYPQARGQERKHLLDILPCIAFYEVLIASEGNRAAAFEIGRCRTWRSLPECTRH